MEAGIGILLLLIILAVGVVIALVAGAGGGILKRKAPEPHLDPSDRPEHMRPSTDDTENFVGTRKPDR
jgi:hypothetical protein